MIVILIQSFLWHNPPPIKLFQHVAQAISFLHANTEVSNDCTAILTKVITLVASEPDGTNCDFTDTATEACCKDNATTTAADAVKSFCVNVDRMAPSITCGFFSPQNPFHFIDRFYPCLSTSPPFPPEGNLLHIDRNSFDNKLIDVKVWYQIEMQALDSVLSVDVHIQRNEFSRSYISFPVKCHDLPKIVHRKRLVYLAPDRSTKLSIENVINILLDMTSIRSNRKFSMLAVPAAMLADANEFGVAPSFAAVRRGLAMDSMAVARSGHMGCPLTGLDMTDHPKDPKRIKRDQFILSAGPHSSTSLYSRLNLGRFPFPIDAPPNFRQYYHSLMTPGQPECPHSENNTRGIKSTTDPLGHDVAVMKCITIVGTAGTNAAHGEDGVPGIDETEKNIDFPESEQEWHVSQATRDFFAAAEATHKAIAGLTNKPVATHVSGKDDSIEFFKAAPPSLSGSADLQKFCSKYMERCGHVSAGFNMKPVGCSLLFGICEHTMGSLPPHDFAFQHGHFKASVSIFLVFIDYLRPIPIRCIHDLWNLCFFPFSALQYPICIVSPISPVQISILQSMGG